MILFLSLIFVLLISIIFFRIRFHKSKALLFFIQIMLLILAAHIRFFFFDHVIAALFGLTHTLGFIYFVSGANEHAHLGSDGTSRPPALEYSSGTGALESTSRSSGSWNDILEEAQALSSTDVLQSFRVENAHVEQELFDRIDRLENLLVHGLPPQLSNGEYKLLVRNHLNDAFNVNHYQNVIGLELFDIKIMELKAQLQSTIVNILMEESEARIQEMLSQSPFHEGDLRKEVFFFLEERANAIPTNTRVERAFFEAHLLHWLGDLTQRRNGSEIYREFVKHFLGG